MAERTRPESDAVSEESTEVNRRKFLKCMAWAGTGIVWTVSASGLLTACGDLTATPTAPTATPKPADESFSFVQISDTHIGFSTDGVNTDVLGTAKQAVDRINALPNRPALVIHTGDISHNSKPAEFDTASQLMTTLKTDKVFYVPGEHDLVNDKGANYRQRFSTNAKPWYSVDYKGVHFIGLSNAGELDAFGMLGDEQINWLKQDLSGVKKDTSLVVFAHVPLYSIYPQWGWETKDVAQVMTMLMPYSAVTVLNGHIHQVLSKVEGNISFYTANATAFPQHRPGVDKPNAYKLPASELLQSIGYRTTTAKGEDFETLRTAYGALNQHRRLWMGSVIKQVGGVVESRTLGERGEQFSRIPKEKQKEAVEFILKHGFHAPKSALDPQVINTLKFTAVAGDVISFQTTTLRGLLSAQRLNRLLDMEVLQGDKAYTIAELVGDVQGGVFEELKADAPKVDPLRRNLQRAYFDILKAEFDPPATGGGLTLNIPRRGPISIDEAPARSLELRAVARMQLRELKKQLDAAIPKAKDSATKLHLSDLSEEIDAVFAARKK